MRSLLFFSSSKRTVLGIAFLVMVGLIAGTANAQLSVTSGLEVWLDAGQGVTYDSATGAVSSWADISGNGHVANVVGSYNPIYSDTNTNLNDLPSLVFAGSSTSTYGTGILQFTDQVMPDHFTDMTIFSVMYSANNQSEMFTLRTGSGTPLVQFGFGNGTTRFVSVDNATINSTMGGVDLRTYGIASGVMQTTGGGTTLTTTFGGGMEVTATGATPASNLGALDCYIGGFNGWPRWSGVVAEVLVYDRALTTLEQNNVADYLSNKYALSWDAVGGAPEPLPEGVLLDEASRGTILSDWETWTMGPGLTAGMPFSDSKRHAQWALPDPESEPSETNSAAGMGAAFYVGEETADAAWEDVQANAIIRMGGDSIADTSVGLAARVQGADLGAGEIGSFYGLYIYGGEEGEIGLMRQTGGLAGEQTWLTDVKLGLDVPADSLGSTDLFTQLTVVTNEDGYVQIDGIVASDAEMTNVLAMVSFLDDSEDRLLGPGSVGFFGQNEGYPSTAANWRDLVVLEATAAVPEPSTIVALLMMFASLLVWRRTR